MDAPSADHARIVSYEGSDVMRRGAPPPTSTTQISGRTSPLAWAPNAIDRPSGDHRGPLVTGDEVSRWGFAPSAAAVQTSAPPARSETKAMLRPSGDTSGAASARDDGADDAPF